MSAANEANAGRTMLSMARSADGGLEPITAPVPQPGPTEVLIRATVVGLNPVDRKTLAGRGMSDRYDPDEPMVVGWDVVGVVEHVGAGVTRFRRGDRVFGMPSFPWPARAYSEYVVAQSRQVALLPDELTDLDAVPLCLSALTAWQAIIDTLRIGAGERILIHAAGGGVGHIAVQLAARRGAEVWATASARHHDELRRLGVVHPIDHRRQPFEEVIQGMDAVLDLVGLHDYPIRSLDSLRRGGRLVVIPNPDQVPARETLAARGISATWMLVEPDYPALEAMARMAVEGLLEPIVAAHRPLRQLEELYRLADEGAPLGKLAATTDAA